MNNTRLCKICAAVAGPTVQATLAAAENARQADVVEIRLDTLAIPAVKPFIDTLSTPLLFTNRAAWEGGFFSGPDDKRLSYLQEAINLGAAYIDIELKTADELKMPLIKQAKNSKTETIISWHSFKSTPSSQALNSILQEQFRSGADIGKIVTMANNYQDVLRVLNLQIIAEEMGFPLIAFCMGQVGKISRIATMELRGFMTYAAADNEEETAPGQLAISKLKQIIEVLDLED